MQERRRLCVFFLAMLSLHGSVSDARGSFGLGGSTPFTSKTATINSPKLTDDPIDNNNNNNSILDANATIENYVASVEEEDAQHRFCQQHRQQRVNTNSNDKTKITKEDNNADQDDNNEPQSQDDTTTSTPEPMPDAGSTIDADANSGVSVKAHNHKKSNAVGDPDDDDSDDDLEDDSSEEWEDFEDDMEELGAMMDSQQMQVEVEVVGDGGDESIDGGDNEEEELTLAKASGSGGVARMGHRLGRRKTRDGKFETRKDSKLSKSDEIIEAWLPHIYLPPSPAALDNFVKNSRLIDSVSKLRLDRRTLYSGLLLEWLHKSSSNRKFLDQSTAQTLQASLSLATQPEWRRAFPRPSALRLFENEVGKSCTLGMQETISMALAHSLGAAMVILDDEIIASIRSDLDREGFEDDDLKAKVLLKTLFRAAKEGNLNFKKGGSIAKCMERDIMLGLDDPYDDRALASFQDMQDMEKDWESQESSESNPAPLPLVLFIRTQSAHSLLWSKSATDALLQQCNTDESINLIVLGSGIDSRTSTLPKDESSDGRQYSDQGFTREGVGQLPGAAPYFGFTQQNQNASGQNDPPGSRRFNIFLARTVDADGVAGILGAIAPPQAGNLFPHMMAMQARERMQNQDPDSPAKAELDRWSKLLVEQMQQWNQNSGGSAVPPPQFFNASLGPFGDHDNRRLPPPNGQQPLPQEVIQKTLEHALSELLDRLADMDDGEPSASPATELSPDLHKAFAQVLRNPHIRNGIAENLAKAAPALSDPKCQGVMLSVYVPPPKAGRAPGSNMNGKQQSNVGSWFQNMLHKQEAADSAAGGDSDENRRRKARQKRARTMAAYQAAMAAQNNEPNQGDKRSKSEKNLARLEEISRPVPIKTPSDPVRAKSWESWVARERGAIIFRKNRKALKDELDSHDLSLQQHTGTRGAGSSLRQMLSVRDLSEEMDEVIKCAVELEAAKGQRLHKSPSEIHENEMDLGVDVTLSQLLADDSDCGVDANDATDVLVKNARSVKYLHPSSLETALTITCRVSPSPAGGLSVNRSPASHRTKEEISALAQDKHERALISQVVSPQDIGVTYDMIGGLSEVKELLRQSITYPLKFPHLYSEGIAREAVKGVLLFGPPGTGKTMLAKAVATEGGASFLSVDASSVENKWLGESEKNAKAVFTLARRLAPCIIFIDEVDSLLSSREGTSDDSAHGTLTSVKTTMMSEWDGLNSGTNGNGEAGSDRVIVIGSTNRPFDLDEAVLRRFPRRILVDLPDLETRREILEVTLAENRLDPSVNLTAIAEQLEGYTGSDIKEVCREAVVQISHEQAKLLDQGLSSLPGDAREDVTEGSLQRLRPVNSQDFENALSKLKRSVSEKGRELARVWEWNDEYGEIKKEKKNHLPHLSSMYL